MVGEAVILLLAIGFTWLSPSRFWPPITPEVVGSRPVILAESDPSQPDVAEGFCVSRGSHFGASSRTRETKAQSAYSQASRLLSSTTTLGGRTRRADPASAMMIGNDRPPAPLLGSEATPSMEITSPPPTSSNALTRRLRALAGKPAGSLVVHEIYRSLQGESTHAGLPCTFVRLTACHLRCTYCDTAHAFNRGETMELGEVVERALATGDRLIEVTGGEPLLQPEVFPLMTALADAGRTVLLETSGSASTFASATLGYRSFSTSRRPARARFWANLEGNLALLKPIDEVVTSSAIGTISTGPSPTSGPMT